MFKNEFTKSNGHVRKKKTSHQEIEILQEKLEKSHGEIVTLQKDIGYRKTQFKSVWKNAPLYPDWRKEEFDVVNVTLDEMTAHPNLLLSENGKQVFWQEKCQDQPDSIKRFDSLHAILGQMTVTKGRFYWEVEVGDADSWDVGVCRDDVTRKGRVTVSPQNGFWAIRRYDGEYWAITSPETQLYLGKKKLCTVGIFLDIEDGNISFYDMKDNSHIFSFSKNSFYGKLRPFLRLWNSMSGTLKTV